MENIALIESFSEFKDEKFIDRVTLMAILEEVFRNTITKQFGTDENFDIIINPDKGDLEIWRNRIVVEDGKVEDPNAEIELKDAVKIEPDFEVGEEVSEEFKIVDLGRRAIQSLRQNLVSKVFEHDSNNIYNQFKDRVGDIFTAEVHHVRSREVILLDDDGNELILPKDRQMAVNVGAMLLVFLALIALVNGILFQGADLFGINDWIKNNTVYKSLSLELILGYIFAPLMWLIGIAKEDITLMGQLLGVKLAASEFVAYIELASLKDISSVIHLTYQKSVIMATIMLCGFANFASIGIQVAGIGILAPKKYKLLTELGLKAMIAGTLVSLLSATMVGMILG